MSTEQRWRCPCGARNAVGASVCERCGQARETASSVCPMDGTPLQTNGWCPHGDGYPITRRECPEVCPQCRHPLRWDGDCPSCKPAGEKPGHLYDFDPYKPDVPSTGHWRILERGPQAIIAPTPEQRAALRSLGDVVLRRAVLRR